MWMIGVGAWSMWLGYTLDADIEKRIDRERNPAHSCRHIGLVCHVGGVGREQLSAQQDLLRQPCDFL